MRHIRSFKAGLGWAGLCRAALRCATLHCAAQRCAALLWDALRCRVLGAYSHIKAQRGPARPGSFVGRLGNQLGLVWGCFFVPNKTHHIILKIAQIDKKRGRF